MNDDRGREMQKKEDASRCPGCNHPQKFCTCPKTGGGDDSAGKTVTKEEKGKKSDTLSQDAAQKLIDALNKHTKKSFWENPPANSTFKDALDQYKKYSTNLEPSEREALSAIFWTQIQKIGTPIIEEFSDGEVKVHFLFPRNKYDYERKKLYISGDFHGFTSTNNARQEMKHLSDTDIMYRVDVMPKDSVVTYQFLQVPPEYQNKNRPDISGPSEALPESFYDTDPIPAVAVAGNDPLNDKLSDKYNKHEDIGLSLFCANVDNDISRISLMKSAAWGKLLDTSQGYLKNLAYRGTYLCDRNNELSEDKSAAADYISDNKRYLDKENTRSVSVFQSNKGKIENLIVIHDGAGYMATGAVECLDALIGKEQIPTAVIFISTLTGLVEKYKQEDPLKYSSGMNPRPIEFGTRVDDYVTFIDKAISQLGYAHVPANNRTLIGSSMSGTASLFMRLKHPDKFGNVVAQAPSYSNREILLPLIRARKAAKKTGQAEDLSARVRLSCGKFDSLEYAQNLNLAHTQELAKVLGGDEDHPLPIHDTGNYGHLLHCWSQELTETLPSFGLRRNISELKAESATHPRQEGRAISSDFQTNVGQETSNKSFRSSTAFIRSASDINTNTSTNTIPAPSQASTYPLFKQGNMSVTGDEKTNIVEEENTDKHEKSNNFNPNPH